MSLSMKDYRVCCWSYAEGSLWFRIFGLGLSISDIRKWPQTFSQRNGYTRWFKLGRFKIVILK